MLKIVIHDLEDYQLIIKMLSDYESYLMAINDRHQTKLEEFGDNAS